MHLYDLSLNWFFFPPILVEISLLFLEKGGSLSCEAGPRAECQLPVPEHSQVKNSVPHLFQVTGLKFKPTLGKDGSNDAVICSRPVPDKPVAALFQASALVLVKAPRMLPGPLGALGLLSRPCCGPALTKTMPSAMRRGTRGERTSRSLWDLLALCRMLSGHCHRIQAVCQLKRDSQDQAHCFSLIEGREGKSIHRHSDETST